MWFVHLVSYAIVQYDFEGQGDEELTVKVDCIM